MLDWLYNRAKRLKKAAFAMSGMGVAVSTATALISPITSWVSNLIAIVGGGIYSTLKNAETAESIATQQRECRLMAESLSLKKYSEEAEQFSLTQILQQTSDLDEEKAKALEKQLLKDEAHIARQYATSNLWAQTLLSLVIAAVNITANLADPKDKQDPTSTKNILNTNVVLLCVLSQYMIHSWWAASNLRQIAIETTGLYTKLSTIHQGLLFRVKEKKAFLQSRQRITTELDILDKEIVEIERRNAELNKLLEEGEIKIPAFRQRYLQLQARFTGFDIDQYLSIADQSQLRVNLARDFPKIENIEKLVEYINIAKAYNHLVAEIGLAQTEFKKGIETLRSKKEKHTHLDERHKVLVGEESKFQQLETELFKLDEMQPS